VDTGIDRLEPEMRAFGFGAPTGLDLTGEPSGVLPSRSWKQKRFRQGLVSGRYRDRWHRAGLLGGDAGATRTCGGHAGGRAACRIRRIC
jgi:hypothetical protein